jgi:hypothetical protein
VGSLPISHYGIIAGRDWGLEWEQREKVLWWIYPGLCKAIAFKIEQDSNRKNGREYTE